MRAAGHVGYVSESGLLNEVAFNNLENLWADNATRRMVAELRYRSALVDLTGLGVYNNGFKLYGLENNGNNIWRAKSLGKKGVLAVIVDNKTDDSRLAALYTFDEYNRANLEFTENVSGAGTYIKKVTYRRGLYQIDYGTYRDSRTLDESQIKAVEEEEEMVSIPTAPTLEQLRKKTGSDNESENGSAGEKPKVDENRVYDVVEQMPSFPGGSSKLMTYLSQNIKYPVVAEEHGIQGRVVVQFVVERDGSISDVKIVNSADPLLNSEAVRVIKSMPKWTPGKQDGQPVRVKYTIPVTFKLQ